MASGINRQAVSDFIRQYGQTALNQLTPDQLKNVLTLLQQGRFPFRSRSNVRQRIVRVPARHNTLNQLVTKLAAATGEVKQTIWQSMLELSGAAAGSFRPNSLLIWRHGYRRGRRCHYNAPTLHTLQAALKQPAPEPDELTAIKSNIATYQIQPQAVADHRRYRILLNHIFLRREREADELEPLSIQPSTARSRR